MYNSLELLLEMGKMFVEAGMMCELWRSWLAGVHWCDRPVSISSFADPVESARSYDPLGSGVIPDFIQTILAGCASFRCRKLGFKSRREFRWPLAFSVLYSDLTNCEQLLSRFLASTSLQEGIVDPAKTAIAILLRSYSFLKFLSNVFHVSSFFEFEV